MDKIKEFAQWVMDAKKITVLTGAGMSTESGIPDFRSENGIYAQEENVEYYISEYYFKTILLIFGINLSGFFH